MKRQVFFIIVSFFSIMLHSKEVFEKSSKIDKESKQEAPKEETVSSLHTIKINEVDFSYQATVGTQILNDNKGEPKASIFFVAYTKQNNENLQERPITFCFNGGPGSASVWLHLGVFGPRRVAMDNQGIEALQPYHLVDNPYSILDMTDLVFIDPVSTGYSRALPGEDVKQFHSVEADVQSVAEFIRLYITRSERWESPKFLAGESYGTTRAAGLAEELHDNHHIFLDGIVLLSSILNFQTITFVSGNDLPYILFLPTYTATALFHHQLDVELEKNSRKTLEEVQNFAIGDYALALMQGDQLENEKKKVIIKKLSRYTGLPESYIEKNNLRVNVYRFAREILSPEKRIVGRFDTRVKGINSDLCSDIFAYDPSLENIIGLFTATFNDYIRRELNWKRDEEYKVLADVWPWDYGCANQYLDVGEKLKGVMSKNQILEVFVASGCFDLATPYFATDYTFAHLGLDPAIRDNIKLKIYDGGHMMYLNESSLILLKKDLVQFIKNHLKKIRTDNS